MRISRYAACSLMLMLAAWAQADDKADKKQATKKLETKPTASAPATTIDFCSKLGLGFGSLDSLGARIEACRNDADPVAIATAAYELSVAEKVAGKKAPLTSSELMAEAVALAKARDSASELGALAIMTSDDKTAAELRKLSGAAKQREADEAAALKSGEQTRGIEHSLIVTNEAEVHMHIYVNGREVGVVPPHGHRHFHVHTHGHTVLDARGHGHRWHEHVEGEYHDYEWTLHDH